MSIRNAPEKTEFYHEPTTVAWMIVSHDELTFYEFLRLNEYRLGMELLHLLWSPELLQDAVLLQVQLPVPSLSRTK